MAYDKSKTIRRMTPLNFNKETELVTEYTPDLCAKVIDFCRQGYFVEGFAGKFNICSKTLHSVWLDRQNAEYEEFRSAVKTAKSALIYYYNSKLKDYIDDEESTNKIGIIRSILSDLMRTVPVALTQLQFEDVDLNETAENRAKRKQLEGKIMEFNLFNSEEINEQTDMGENT